MSRLGSIFERCPDKLDKPFRISDAGHIRKTVNVHHVGDLRGNTFIAVSRRIGIGDTEKRGQMTAGRRSEGGDTVRIDSQLAGAAFEISYRRDMTTEDTVFRYLLTPGILILILPTRIYRRQGKRDS